MIIDVRDYRMVPGKLDLLIERFERLFFDEQERLGAKFVGVFRDAGDADRFVFLRAMPDLPTRKRVLTEFYAEGAMWRANREEVNGWLADTDDVLLTRPVSEWLPPATGPSVVAMLQHIGRAPLDEARARAVRAEVEAAVAAAGGRVLVTLATDPAENNYPAHPIRTGDHGLIWFATFDAPRALALPGVVQRTLVPTARSRLR